MLCFPSILHSNEIDTHLSMMTLVVLQDFSHSGSLMQSGSSCAGGFISQLPPRPLAGMSRTQVA